MPKQPVYSEKANCPGGNWSTCPQGGTTQHYINLSNVNDNWIGVGESATPEGPGMQYPGSYAFGAIIGYK